MKPDTVTFIAIGLLAALAGIIAWQVVQAIAGGFVAVMSILNGIGK